MDKTERKKYAFDGFDVNKDYSVAVSMHVSRKWKKLHNMK